MLENGKIPSQAYLGVGDWSVEHVDAYEAVTDLVWWRSMAWCGMVWCGVV